jgi:hypothetical protein
LARLRDFLVKAIEELVLLSDQSNVCPDAL